MRPRLAATLLAAAALGCARPGTPPGGEQDRSPPRVVAVSPDHLGTLTDLDESVVIRFDERISERLEGIRHIRDAVIVSPATSPVEAERHSRSIEIDLIRDWEPDLVYRVVIQPLFRDLFGNRREEPVELVFSTGAPIEDAALAGFVADRITGEPVVGARVEALRREDGRTYVAVTDSAGFFAMRYMPAGGFDIRAWMDQDRDRQIDFGEMHDSTDAEFAVPDTAVVELALLPGDSTPARLVRADALDSARVRLLFDDYFAPGPVAGQATLFAMPDSAPLGEGRLLHGSRLDSLRAIDAALARAAQRATDSLQAVAAADTLESDSLAVAPGPEPEPEPEEGEEAGPPLPAQQLILLSPVTLRPDSRYLVVVRGVLNIRGVPGGGGSAELQGPAPPADTAAADTVGERLEPPDSVPPPPDTSGTGPPSGGAR